MIAEYTMGPVVWDALNCSRRLEQLKIEMKKDEGEGKEMGEGEVKGNKRKRKWEEKGKKAGSYTRRTSSRSSFRTVFSEFTLNLPCIFGSSGNWTLAFNSLKSIQYQADFPAPAMHRASCSFQSSPANSRVSWQDHMY